MPRRAARWLVAGALSLAAVGIAVQPVTSPLVTKSLSGAFSRGGEAGLPDDLMAALAEQVRAFVVSGDGTLPEEVGGRSGFDARAVRHLEDVAGVLAAGRMATWGLVGALVVLAAYSLARLRADAVAAVLSRGGWLAVALPAVAALLGIVSFDALFSGFHAVLFPSGTWTFPSDSLLILLFPEEFWIACAGLWAAFTTAVGLACVIAAGVLKRVAGGRARPAPERDAPASS